MFPVEEITIAQLHAGYLEGKTTAREVTEAYLERIAAYDKRGPYLNALITVNPNAVADAANLDAALKSNGKLTGPLHGIPIIVKDNIDTSGSVRAPASINNLVGIRPTVGLVSRTGMAPLDSQRDTPGPMTRTVEDAARLLDVMAGTDPADPRTAGAEARIPPTYTAFLDRAGLKDARIGVLRQVFKLQDGADPRVVELFETAIADLRPAGAEIVDDFTVPGLEKFRRPPQTAAHYKADWERFFAYEGPRFPVKTVAELRDAPAGKSVHALHAARVA